MKKIILFLFVTLLILSGCSREDWFAKNPDEDKGSFPNGNSDHTNPPHEPPSENPTNEFPFEDPTVPAPSFSQIERIKNLPRISVSFDKGFESIKPAGSIWEFNVNERNSFYENGALKITRFHISNFSDQDIQIRLGSVDIKGNIRQYLNNYVFKGKNSVFGLELYSYWMAKDIDISNQVKISFENASSMSSENSYTLSKGATLSGYLTVDLSQVPTCHLPKVKNYEDNGWIVSELFRVLRVQMNFQMVFQIEKSLSGEPPDFYMYSEAWISDPKIESENYFLQSDLTNQFGSLYELSMNDNHTAVEEREIKEFSCHGLYLESPEEK